MMVVKGVGAKQGSCAQNYSGPHNVLEQSNMEGTSVWDAVIKQEKPEVLEQSNMEETSVCCDTFIKQEKAEVLEQSNMEETSGCDTFIKQEKPEVLDGDSFIEEEKAEVSDGDDFVEDDKAEEHGNGLENFLCVELTELGGEAGRKSHPSGDMVGPFQKKKVYSMQDFVHERHPFSDMDDMNSDSDTSDNNDDEFWGSMRGFLPGTSRCRGNQSRDVFVGDAADFDPLEERPSILSPSPILPFSGTPGMALHLKPYTPLDFIQLFITRDLLKFLAAETNCYAEKHILSNPSPGCNAWLSCQDADIAKYLGLVILMGIVKLPTIKDYWSTRPCLQQPVFGTTMSYKRFMLLQTFFLPYETLPTNNIDQLAEVRQVLEYFKRKFRSVYTPAREISLINSKWKYKGQSKVYSTQEPTRYEVNFHILSERESGYVNSFETYCGTYKSGQETVFRVMKPLLNKGYKLYMDNYYSSVILAKSLLQEGVQSCSMLRIGAKRYYSIKKTSKLQKKVFFYALQMALHNAYVLYMKYSQDKKKTTFKGFTAIFYESLIFFDGTKWPDMDENIFQDMKLQDIGSTYAASDIGSTNAASDIGSTYAVSDNTNNPVPGPSGIVDATALSHSYTLDDNEDLAGGKRKRPRLFDSFHRMDMSMRHTREHMGGKKRRRCRVCYANHVRKDTRYMCSVCKVPLCEGQCFDDYHTLADYKNQMPETQGDFHTLADFKIQLPDNYQTLADYQAQMPDTSDV